MIQNSKSSTGSKTAARKKSTAVHKARTPQQSPQAILQRAQMQPSSLTTQDIIQLQRTVGNSFVANLLANRSSNQKHQPQIQRKPTYGRSKTAITPLANHTVPIIQRAFLEPNGDTLKGRINNPEVYKSDEVQGVEGQLSQAVEALQNQPNTAGDMLLHLQVLLNWWLDQKPRDVAKFHDVWSELNNEIKGKLEEVSMQNIVNSTPNNRKRFGPSKTQ